VIYRQQNPISYDNRYDNRSYDRKGNDGDRRGIGRVLIATDVINAKARSAQGEELGYIDDVVLDMKDGRILYAVLVHGGVLGVGAKQFAIPFEELSDLRNSEVRLDVANSELDRQDGFEDDNWPQTANAYWSSKMSSPRSSSEPVTRWCKASDLINGNCVNKEGKTIGQVDDLIMDANRELVAYAIISCKERHALVAVPVAAMQVRDNGDAVVDLTSERMNDLETFDNVHDRDWSSVRLNRHFHSQFGVPAYWESASTSLQNQP
jgi:sporulation protein YlmC with PRC-barrel domain